MELFDGISNLEQIKRELHAELSRGTTLYEIVSYPGAVQNIRSKLMRAHGSQGVLDFAKYLESSDKDIRIGLLDPSPSSRYAVNLSYLVAETFWEAYPHYFRAVGRKFDVNDAAIFFSNASNAQKFFTFYGEKKIKLEEFSASFLMMAALAATVYLNELESREVLTGIRNTCVQGGPGERLVHLAITRRLQSKPQTRPENHEGRTAVIIAGQMRGMDSALTGLIDKIDLPKADYYVSTWAREGRTSADKERAPRVFEPEAVPLADSLSADALRMVDAELRKANTTDKAEMKARIEKLLGDSVSSQVSISDEDEPVFAVMSNGGKMHYHNMVWPIKLGSNYLSENYDYVVKVRPDMILGLQEGKTLNLEVLRALGDDEIGDDHPQWLLEPWGFGVGDQLFYGKSEAMEKLLSIWPGISDSTRVLTELWGKADPTIGHINLGLEMWMLGYKPAQMPFKKLGLAAPAKVSKGQLEEILRQVEVK